jgi:hypothetical protein
MTASWLPTVFAQTRTASTEFRLFSAQGRLTSRGYFNTATASCQFGRFVPRPQASNQPLQAPVHRCGAVPIVFPKVVCDLYLTDDTNPHTSGLSRPAAAALSTAAVAIAWASCPPCLAPQHPRCYKAGWLGRKLDRR